MRDAPGQPFGNGGLADAGFTDQQRIVLAATAQYLDHAIDFVFAADQRIDLALGSGLVQVLRELVERTFLGLAFNLGFLDTFGRFLRIDLLVLAHAVGDEVDHVEAGNALLVQVVDRVRVFFTEDRHQHVSAGHFLLAVRGRLHVHDRALDNALKAERRLGVNLACARHGRCVVTDKISQRFSQILNIDSTGTQHFRGRWVVEKRKQQMLNRDEFMPCLPGFDKGHV